MTYKLVVLNVLLASILCYPREDVIELPTNNILGRSRRQTNFRNQTQLSFQFNLGVSTATPVKTILVNYIFQADFKMPWNRTVIPWELLVQNAPIISSRRKREEHEQLTIEQQDQYSEGRLHHFYKYLEDILNAHGHNGRPCMLKALCQLAAEPLKTKHDEDLLLDIANFIFNPYRSVEYEDTHKDSEIHTYMDAVDNGRNGFNCERVYKSCSIAFIDYFTKTY